MSSPTDLELWTARNQPPARILEFVRRLDRESTYDDGVLDPAILEIMSNIFAATDEDAIFAAANAGTTAGKEFVGQPFGLKAEDITYKKSAPAFKDIGGFPWYALTRVLDFNTGEKRVVNCGGLSYMSTLYALRETGMFAKPEYDEYGMPLVLELKPTASGYGVILLKKYSFPRVTARVPESAEAE